MSIQDIIIASLTVLVGSTLQGSIGFGFGLFASPILVLIDPQLVPAPLLLLTLVLTSFLVVRERTAIDIRGLRWALVGRMAGTVVAGGVLSLISVQHIELLFGFLVLVGVTMSVSGLRFQPRRRVLFGAGLLSAVMGTIASIGGPPMALVYQDAPASRLRATMSAFFWVGTILSLFILRLVGRFGATEINLTILLLPALFLGLLMSRWTSSFVDGRYTRPAVLLLATAGGLVVIFRQLL